MDWMDWMDRMDEKGSESSGTSAAASSASSIPARSPSVGWAWAFAAATLAVALRALCADSRGFWLDEYYTLRAARMPLDELIRDRLAAGHSPLHFVFAKLGFLFGDSERALRSTSAFAAGAAVATTFGLARAARMEKDFPVLLAICVFHPYWATIGTDFRYMMPLVAVAAGAAWAAFALAERGGAAHVAAFVAVAGAMLWIHGSAQFFWAGLLAFGVWEAIGRKGEGRARWAVAAAAGGAFLAGVPLLLLLAGGEGGADRSWPAPDDWFKEFPQTFFSYYDAWTSFLGLPDTPVKYPTIFAFWIAIGLGLREARLRGEERLARMLASLVFGSIAAIGLVAMLVDEDAQGPFRYAAPLSVPATLCAALAWNATLPRRALLAWRASFVALVALQFAGAALDRGDRHREAVRWVVEAHRGEDPVLVSSKTINEFAFDYLGFERMDLLRELTERKPSLDRTREELSAIYGDCDLGFALLYHNRAPVEEAVEAMVESGFFAGARTWNSGKKVKAIAVARTAEGRRRLEALEGVPRIWGPARGDD